MQSARQNLPTGLIGIFSLSKRLLKAVRRAAAR
jgi:hypothetical protein